MIRGKKTHMEKRFDVVALGELLIDFTENGTSQQGNYMFEANPGGAPCNVLAMLNKLGDKTAFIGKVGDDFLGHHLKKVIESEGINAEGLCLDKDIHTTLAFVHTMADGERDFSFYRNPGADVMLQKSEVSEEIISNAKLFHFGSLSLTHEGVREATRYAIEIAEQNDLLISFDPNLREPLWKSLDEAREQIAYGMEHCDIMKISDNEIQWFTGEEDFDEGIRRIQGDYQIPIILLSRGADGSSAYWADRKIEVPSFKGVKTIETTGAGDTFCACVLHGILHSGVQELEQIDEEMMFSILSFANAAAKLVTTRKGALRVMPEKEEVEQLMRGAR